MCRVNNKKRVDCKWKPQQLKGLHGCRVLIFLFLGSAHWGILWCLEDISSCQTLLLADLVYFFKLVPWSSCLGTFSNEGRTLFHWRMSACTTAVSLEREHNPCYCENILTWNRLRTSSFTLVFREIKKTCPSTCYILIVTVFNVSCQLCWSQCCVWFVALRVIFFWVAGNGLFFLSQKFKCSVTVDVIPNTGEMSSLDWFLNSDKLCFLVLVFTHLKKCNFLFTFFLCSCVEGQTLWEFFCAVLVFFEPASHNSYLFIFPLDTAFVGSLSWYYICVELCCLLDPINNTVVLGYSVSE